MLRTILERPVKQAKVFSFMMSLTGDEKLTKLEVIESAASANHFHEAAMIW